MAQRAPSLKQLLEKALTDLSRMGDLEASAVISRDGLLIAHYTPEGTHAETFAAMAATMMGAAETAMSELKKSVPDRVIVESSTGRLIAKGAGPKAILVVSVRPEAGLGLVLLEMDKTANKVKQLLE